MAPRYDLDVFIALNEEYADKRIVPSPRDINDPQALEEQARARARALNNRFGNGITGARVLEVGCGRGQLCRALAEEFGCDVTGIDTSEYDSWQGPTERVRFVRGDISHDVSALGRFDFIYSYSVWEHIRHPYEALVNTRELLVPEGQMYLQAQLYRGPKASHRYREVFFPWPHLLFDDEVFKAYYRSIGRPANRASWVNKLTYAQYLMYFDLAGWERKQVRASDPIFDEGLYTRFEEVLGAYPKWDLSHDVIFAVLVRPNDTPRSAPAGSTIERPAARFAQRVARGLRRRAGKLRKALRSVAARARARAAGPRA
jgi:SAM-dependent methyltransferase